MDFVRNSLFSLLIILAVIFSPFVFASVPKPLDLQITLANNSILIGDTVNSQVLVEFNESIEQITINYSASGVLQTMAAAHTLVGPWQQDNQTRFEFDIQVTGSGVGQLDIVFEGFDKAGTSRYIFKKSLFALSDGSFAWLNTSSILNARIQRLQQTASSKTGVRQKTDITAAENIDDIITAYVASDDSAIPDVELTQEQQKLQDYYTQYSIVPAAKPRTKISGRANATITVKGLVQWTDRSGATHPLPFADVEVFDEGLVLNTSLATVTTDAAGKYTATVTYDDGLGGTPDIFVRVYARSRVADLRADTLLASTYRMQSPTTDNVADGSTQTINLTASNAGDEHAVFSIHHALVMIGSYAGNLAGVMPSQVVTRFPTTRSTSLFDGTELHILQADKWDWDVIHHEYGHYFMSIHGIQNNPGGKHSFSDNLSQRRGSKDIGIRLAWGEGWPTFFGISGQALMGASALAVPDVGDTRYQDTDDATTDLNLETRTGLGEDNEVSVMAALWDMFDAAEDSLDKSVFTDKFLFDTIKAAGAKTVGAAWEAYAATQTTQQKTVLGGLFSQSKIAPELTAPADSLRAGGTDAAPTFKWNKNGGGVPNPLNDFTIRFYNSDFSTVVFQKELGDVDEFTPNNTELSTILGGGLVKWVVEGKNTTAPVTSGGVLGKYWSIARTIGGIDIVFVIDDTGSMSEEISSISSALVDYVDAVEASLEADETPPSIQLITFKDNVSVRVTSNDLDLIRTEVNALSADGGDDCPEFGTQALDVASINISPGGTILFATDASSQPGTDIGALISRLNSKAVTINTILSGDCEGISSSKPSARNNNNENALQPAGFQSTVKPGEDADDLPQGDIVDVGQSPLDDFGDNLEGPSLLPLGTTGVRGSLGAAPDTTDVFSSPLQQGVYYTFELKLENGDPANDLAFEIIDSDKTTVLHSEVVDSATTDAFTFSAPAAGNYFVKLSRDASLILTAYTLKGFEDSFAPLVISQSSVEMYAAITQKSGGAFIVRDSVNSGGSTEYSSAVLNIMMSTLGPTVLFATPEEVPQNAELSISLHGENTGWVPNKTSVEFSGTGLTTRSVTVVAANRLDVTVKVDVNAPLGFQDVQVMTNLGGVSETVKGVNVINVVPQIVDAAILSIETSQVIAGSDYTLIIRGINTDWNVSSEVDLGSDITIEKISVASNTQMRIDISVAEGASSGFRTATINGISKERALFVTNTVTAYAHVDGVTPVTAKRNQEKVIEIIGASTAFDILSTQASFGAGISIIDVDVIDGQKAKVTIKVDKEASIGYRDIIMSTASETAVLLNGFLIEGATEKDAKAVGVGPYAEVETPEEKNKSTFQRMFGNSISAGEITLLIALLMLMVISRRRFIRNY